MTKYRNEKVKTLNNGTFDSKLEFKHFCELQMLERAGKISNLLRQVTIPNNPAIFYFIIIDKISSIFNTPAST